MMRYLAQAFAICIRDPSAIVYLPIKKNVRNYNVVFSRHAVDAFKPSVWYDLKPLLNKKHLCGKYVFDYNLKKLKDYADKLLEKHNVGDDKRDWFLLRQKEVGDTIFWQMSLDEYYIYHASIIEACEYMEQDENKDKIWNGWIGWVLSDKIAQETKEWIEINDSW